MHESDQITSMQFSCEMNHFHYSKACMDLKPDQYFNKRCE